MRHSAVDLLYDRIEKVTISHCTVWAKVLPIVEPLDVCIGAEAYEEKVIECTDASVLHKMTSNVIIIKWQQRVFKVLIRLKINPSNQKIAYLYITAYFVLLKLVIYAQFVLGDKCLCQQVR